MSGCAQVCAGVPRCTWLYPDVCGCAWVCMGMQRFAHVCGMNFQNFFRRIADFNMYPIRILIII